MNMNTETVDIWVLEWDGNEPEGDDPSGSTTWAHEPDKNEIADALADVPGEARLYWAMARVELRQTLKVFPSA